MTRMETSSSYLYNLIKIILKEAEVLSEKESSSQGSLQKLIDLISENVIVTIIVVGGIALALSLVLIPGEARMAREILMLLRRFAAFIFVAIVLVLLAGWLIKYWQKAGQKISKEIDKDS